MKYALIYFNFVEKSIIYRRKTHMWV